MLTDLMRTLAGIVGYSLPERAAEDSFDVRHAWFGNRKNRAGRDHLIHHSLNGMFAIRVGKWKLIDGTGSGGLTIHSPMMNAPPGQLYDMEADPAETTNLWESHPEVVLRLQERLRQSKQLDRTTPKTSPKSVGR
jgi:arylsulfatase A-like enzyme